MKIATINLKTAPTLYLEADCITPDSFAGKSKDEILALPVYEGRECYSLGTTLKSPVKSAKLRKKQRSS